MQLDLLQESAPTTQKAEAVSPSTPPLQSKTKTAMPEGMQIADEIKAPGAFKTISEVAEFLGVPQHVLRFWESRFPQIRPMKLRGGRRYYRPQDIETLSTIKDMLYKQGYTIKGARKMFGKKPLVAEAAQPKPQAKPVLSEKQLSQITVIRQELLGMRDVLKPFVS